MAASLKSEDYAPRVYEPEMGKHKTPSLRNVDLRPSPGFVKAYMHNGFFKSLEEVVHFCNARDAGQFPAAEYAATVDKDSLGNLGLTLDEEAAVVAFLMDAVRWIRAGVALVRLYSTIVRRQIARS